MGHTFLPGLRQRCASRGNRSVVSRLAAFDTDIAKERHAVTTIVMTEFGRRVYENSSLGTDHGRGFALAAIGDHINGGTIHVPGQDWKPAKLISWAPRLTVNFDYRSVLAEVLSGVAATVRSKQYSHISLQNPSDCSRACHSIRL